MKKILLLILFLLTGISFNVKAETSEEIYNKLLQDCNELKSKNFVSADCEMLNLPNLQLTVKNGLYEANAAGIASEYSKIVNDLNMATIYGDYATICENLKEKSKTAQFGEYCKLPDDCWESDQDKITESAVECLNIVIPVTRDCRVWFEPEIIENYTWDKRNPCKNRIAPLYAMKLNQKGLNNLFFKRMLKKEIGEQTSIADMHRCGAIDHDFNEDGSIRRFSKRPIVSILGYSTSVYLDEFKNRVNSEWSSLKTHGFNNGKDFLNWMTDCFFEILGDRISNLKQDENGCWY